MIGFFIIGTAAFGSVITFGADNTKTVSERVSDFFTLETRRPGEPYYLPLRPDSDN